MQPLRAPVTSGGIWPVALAQHWPLVLTRGICAIVFGLMAILSPGLTLAWLVLLFAAYLIVDGVLAIISAGSASRRREPWLALALEGVLGVTAAVFVAAMPALTIIVMVYAAGIWAVLSGVALLIASASFRSSGWLMAFAAAASVLFGCLLLSSPVGGALVIAAWLGIYALVFGVALLGTAWRLRGVAHRAAH